jgi:hypothetical protein
MAIPLNISLEQLAETLNSLSGSERETLLTLLDDQWNEKQKINRTIKELLDKSSEQHRQGKTRASEDIIRESKEKYGL